MRGLEGKVALVTGAAQGMGQEFCRRLAEEGANIAAVDIAACDETVGLVTALGRKAIGLQVDVTDEAATRAMAEQVESALGRIDILVNNAAIYAGLTAKPYDRIPVDEWDRVMAVNVKGPWLCAKAVAPAMTRAGKGKIINISSGTYMAGAPALVHYAVSKAAIAGLTVQLAVAMGPQGIRVNTIAPGLTMTPATYGLLNPEAIEASARIRALSQNIEPSDIAAAVAFLASADSDAMTGSLLVVDAGRGYRM
jgi:NAD(P)-dependent dehydrogenase (short-subunit alcohol dehydrogenase family)